MVTSAVASGGSLFFGDVFCKPSGTFRVTSLTGTRTSSWFMGVCVVEACISCVLFIGEVSAVAMLSAVGETDVSSVPEKLTTTINTMKVITAANAHFLFGEIGGSG